MSDAGGFGFAAHPLSAGSERFKRAVGDAVRATSTAADGVELWSFVTDTGRDSSASWRDVLRFVLSPNSVLDHPPERNLRAWDRMCAERRVAALGGLDAHQIGVRIAGHVPVRLMSYRRSFRLLRTHVLAGATRASATAVVRRAARGALRTSRSTRSRPRAASGSGRSLAPARATGRRERRRRGPPDGRRGARRRLHAPRRAAWPGAASSAARRVEVASNDGLALQHEVDGPGVYRVEATLERHGRERTWIVSNPIYFR